MTLVVTINGPETIWVLADRRLSDRGRIVKEDARKIMFLEADDGVAILAYTGLGATRLGTEPSDWMSRVLRGRRLLLEKSLGVLADAMKREFPKHLRGIPGGVVQQHNILVPAFHENEARLYSIDMITRRGVRDFKFRYTRHVVQKPNETKQRTARMALGGSGSILLMQDKTWMRDLLRLVRASDRKQVRPDAVADRLAVINNRVSENVGDNSVGPRSIVAWRHRKGGVHKGGGAHRYYQGEARDSGGPLPTIANGMDVTALIGVMMPHMQKRFEAMHAGESTEEIDTEAMNADLAKLPDKPDETLS